VADKYNKTVFTLTIYTYTYIYIYIYIYIHTYTYTYTHTYTYIQVRRAVGYVAEKYKKTVFVHKAKCWTFSRDKVPMLLLSNPPPVYDLLCI
jgi:hypothetical protein